MSLRVAEGVDKDLLEIALKKVIASHEALLTWFEVNETNEPVAYVDPDFMDTFKIPVHDLSQESEDSIPSLIGKIEITVQSDLIWTTFANLCRSFHNKKAPNLFLFRSSLGDRWFSWRYLLEDLERSYEALSQGRKISLLPKAQLQIG